MSAPRNLCVFCGSSMGRQPAYRDAAVTVGALLVKRGYGLVYGGARVGLMGVVADATLAAGGRAIGVLPEAMQDRELAHEGLDQLHIVDSMSERKTMMADLSCGFLALPGGIGTVEEITEMLTLSILGYQNKPCGVLNTNGYFDSLLAAFEHMIEEEFFKSDYLDLLMVESDPKRLLDRMGDYRVPEAIKWG